MSSLRSDAQKTDEKRRSPRVGVGIRGAILLHSTRRILSVFIRDLSLGGVGITCDQAIESGKHFSLLLTKADGKATHILYEVRHCRLAMDGIYDIGAQQVAARPSAAVETPSNSKQDTAGVEAVPQPAAPAPA